MASLIKQDYEFDLKSLVYGKFLQECYESYPDVKITTVTSSYPTILKETSNQVVSVDVPEEVAVVLKLRFGDHLRIRPVPVETEGLRKLKDSIYNKKKEAGSYSLWPKKLPEDDYFWTKKDKDTFERFKDTMKLK